MVAPGDTLWDYEPHTKAKHELLVRYLHAWFPIMSDRNLALNVIDGFAGPGRYTGGELGSPLLMIEAFTGHKHRTPAMDKVQVHFDFIEERPDRVAHLAAELGKIALPANVQVAAPHEGSFDEVMTTILDNIPATHVLAPTFVFIDPFGYTGHGIELSSRILAFRKCEVLIYVPWPSITRFLHQASIENALDNLFGDRSWTAARTTKGKPAAEILHSIFLERVRKAAGFSLAFEVDAAKGRGWAGYTLYFGTGHPMGLEKMKVAMWAVDPAAGSGFAYADDPDQLVMFDSKPDLGALEALLRGRFETKAFTIEQAETFTTVSTPFAATKHLKRGTLEVAERAGRLRAWHDNKPKRHAGQYPPRTRLQFTDQPALEQGNRPTFVHRDAGLRPSGSGRPTA